LSVKSEVPIWVEVKQSRYLLILIILTHSLAILSVLMPPLFFGLKLLLIPLIFGSLYFQLYRYKQEFYLFVLKHTTQFSWQLLDKADFVEVQILGSSVISEWLIILHVQIGKKQRSLLVFQDAVPAEIYRQLRVSLKITSLTER